MKTSTQDLVTLPWPYKDQRQRIESHRISDRLVNKVVSNMKATVYVMREIAPLKYR